MRRWKSCLLSLLSLLVLPGCAHVLTINQAPTHLVQGPMIPSLTKAGSADAELNFGLNGLGGKVAVAPVRGLVLTAAGRKYRADKGTDELRSGEIGLGFHWETSPNTYFGIGAGIGAGAGKSQGHRYETWYHFSWSGNGAGTEYDSLSRRATSRYTTVYLMPYVVEHMLDNKLEIAAAGRLSLLRYRELQIYTDHQVSRNSGVAYQASTVFDGTARQRLHGQLSLLLAYALTPRLWLTGQGNLQLSLQRQTRPYDYPPLYLTAGLRFRIGKL